MRSMKKVTRLALAMVATASVACHLGSDAKTSAAPTAPAVATVPSAATLFTPLTNEQAVDLFDVEADEGQYWRLFALDRYDGVYWTMSASGGPDRIAHLSAPATLPGPVDPSGQILTQTVHILDGYHGYALPMAETADAISGPIGGFRWDPVRSQAFADHEPEPGLTYTVRSRIVVPTPAELDEVDLSGGTYGRWISLPPSLDPRIRKIANRWTEGARTTYREVLAIQQHFQDGSFTYSTDVGAIDDPHDLLRFLTQTKTGYCVHYATAMAVLLRSLGIPARIGVGYRVGTRQEDGSYLVRNSDIHGWVEVLFPGYGWLQFEPEAGTAHPDADVGTYLHPAD